MSNFKVTCPKCSSLRVSMTRDLQARWGKHPEGQPILHCATCGKELYGDAATAEVERQRAAWEEKAAAEAAAEEAAREAARQATMRRPRFLDASPVDEITNAALLRKLRSESNLVSLMVERPRRDGASAAR